MSHRINNLRDRILTFALVNRGEHAWRGYSPEEVVKIIEHHCSEGSLLIQLDHGNVKSIMTYVAKPGCIYVQDVVAEQGFFLPIILALMERFPGHSTIYRHHGKLVHLNEQDIVKLAKKLYGIRKYIS